MADDTARCSDALSTVLAWLRAPDENKPVDDRWVPGASVVERRHLTKLGGLVEALVPPPEQGQRHDAFEAKDLREWLRGGPIPPTNVADAARAVLSSAGEVGLAAIYSGVVSSRSRRTLGTFFTPSAEVSWMISRWKEYHPAPDAVVDVGAGVGAFTAVAGATWPKAGVWAIDINPITLGLLALRVHPDFSIRGVAEREPGIHIVLDDFTLWMKHGWAEISGRRLLLGNPPYTRLQLLPPDQRERLSAAAGGLCGKRASLSALITAQSLNALEDDDGLCLLLPAQWLEAEYARPLREKLWSLASRRIELRLFANGLFDDATVDAVALMIGPVEKVDRPIVLSSTENDTPREVTVRGSCPAEFRSLFERDTRDKRRADREAGVALGDLLYVRRGQATGANAFFAVSDDNAAAEQLPAAVRTPLVRRLLPHPDRITTTSLATLPSSKQFSLLLLPTEARQEDSHVRKYVEAGEEQLLDRRHLCADRPVWFDLRHQVVQPDLIIGQSTKDRFRIVENEAHAAILNNLYGLTWRPHVPPAAKREVIDWLRSDAGQSALRESARAQGSGLLKLEPSALTRLPLPKRFKRYADLP